MLQAAGSLGTVDSIPKRVSKSDRPWRFEEGTKAYSRSVSSSAQTSGTDNIWADSVVKAGAVSRVLLMEPRPIVASASASVASASVPVVPARVGDGGGQVAELLKPHIGGSVCPSTSSSFSVPIQ